MQCKNHAMNLPALNETIPLDCAPWVLAWYQKNVVKAIGFRTAKAAEAAYNAFSTDQEKVLETSSVRISYSFRYN